jgi:hypothetical protein
MTTTIEEHPSQHLLLALMVDTEENVPRVHLQKIARMEDHREETTRTSVLRSLLGVMMAR